MELLGRHSIPAGQTFFLGMLVNDRLASLGALLVLFSGLAVVMLSPRSIEGRRLFAGEYYGLLLFAIFGILFLLVAQELLTIFISIEVLSLSLYVMTGIDRRDPRALEAGFKYFILGSLASAFFIFGAAFLFGATGSTRLDVIGDCLSGIILTE